ncbi:MAG: sigma-70 family RNA polymerase sigma factor [Verrucomicrobiae bacterium]|nr:sigma-70 family RNA polymerase sigma factor [Verrucomicrobiae bacterium]
MHDRSDIQLLQDYAVTGSEAAFRELVTRHTDFVFSAALRQVESPDLAGDVAQSVFTDLARKARPVAEKMPGQGSLAGWLHRSTRYAALNHLRDTRRRQSNERQAMEQLLTNTGSAPDWEHIKPVLDEALDSLGDEDREALLLRYFKNQDFRAIGLALGTSDDTAQKRVSRAVDRLRDYFSQRHVTIGASGLVGLISANAVQSAPVGLAAAITTAALAGTAAVSTSTVIAATKTIAMTTLQKTLVTAALTTAIGGGIYEAHQAARLRNQNQSLQQQLAPLADQVQQLRQQRDLAASQQASLADELAKSKSNEQELLKLRNEITQLRGNPASDSMPANTMIPTAQVETTRTSAASAEQAAREAAGRALGRAVVRGDAGAFENLLAESKGEHESYSTNQTGLDDAARRELSVRTFAPINLAFKEIAEAAVNGSQPALDAVIRAIQTPELHSLATQSLGLLAGQGNDQALEMLIHPEKYGFTLSSTVNNLRLAAEAGNQKAIDALAAVAQNPSQKALWLMAADNLAKAAADGNTVAVDALITMSSSTNRNVQRAVANALQGAAANQNVNAAAALRAMNSQ